MKKITAAIILAIAIFTSKAQTISVDFGRNAWIIEVTAERFDTLKIETILGGNCLHGFKKSETYTYICNGGTEYFAVPISNHITITVGNIWRHFHFDIQHIDQIYGLLKPISNPNYPYSTFYYYEVTENARTIDHKYNKSAWGLSKTYFNFSANKFICYGKVSDKNFRNSKYISMF